MSYIDVAYIVLRTDAEELKQVCGEEDLTESNVILQAIADAEEFVNESLAKIYTIPLETVPATIQRVTYCIAIYFIYSYRYQSELPVNIVNDYKWALEYLQGVEKMEKQVIDTTEKTTMGTTIVTNKTSDDKYFNSTRLLQIL